MLPILAAFIAVSIADRPGLAVGTGGVLVNGTNFAGIANGETTGISAVSWLPCWRFAAGYIVQFLKKITASCPPA